MNLSRRTFALGSALALAESKAVFAQQVSESLSVEVELPRVRVPLSFIIDDSTCLVNMGKFCMPQFAATYPERADYQQPWQDWPDEIPDAFVRQFGTWCAEHGVKGKYSIVPYPACVGWLDRTLPGWSQKQLSDSLQLVRDLMVPNWDIHPEMITHTRVIDLKTGRPFQDYSPKHMENSYPQEDVSVDYLASYLAYALKILKNCDLPCEGITTPGGFGNRVKDKLPQAVFEAVRDVYGSELPHYFKYVANGDESTEPRLEAMRDEATLTPSLTVNVPAGTGDWFGGWEGAAESQGQKYCNEDATSGRMVELIEQRRPAVMLCHWPGMYCGGSLAGFHDFQQVVTRLDGRFSKETIWMKVSEIGRYWAAKELTRIRAAKAHISFHAPFSCPDFTLRIQGGSKRQGAIGALRIESGENSGRDGVQVQELERVSEQSLLKAGTFFESQEGCLACFHLQKGASVLKVS